MSEVLKEMRALAKQAAGELEAELAQLAAEAVRLNEAKRRLEHERRELLRGQAPGRSEPPPRARAPHRLAKAGMSDMRSVRSAVIEMLRDGEMRLPEIIEKSGLEQDQARALIGQLKRAGQLERGSKRGRYRLSALGRSLF